MDEAKKVVPEIDYANSILKNRMVYIRRGWFIFERIQNAFILLLITSMLYASFQEPASFYYLMPVISVLLFVYIIINLIFLNSMIKVQGQQALINKENAIATLNHFYKDLTFSASEENILRDVQVGSFNGRCITLLFYNESVYFHIATLGRGGVINPFPAIFNYFKCRKIANNFVETQKTNN